MENELLRESSPAWRAACLFTGRGRADERRDLACPGRLYGLQRVCRLWALPRSSFYHAVNRNPAPLPPARRGPAPPVGKASLLAAIKADLASSPFRGEGHRIGQGPAALRAWAAGRAQSGAAADARAPAALALPSSAASGQ